MIKALLLLVSLSLVHSYERSFAMLPSRPNLGGGEAQHYRDPAKYKLLYEKYPQLTSP